MNVTGPIINELTHEALTTRRMFERTPEAQFAYKPHEKSMSLAVLAGHITETLSWGIESLESGEMVFDPANYSPFVPKTTAELIQAFDSNVKVMTDCLRKIDGEKMFELWQLKSEGKVILEMPRIAMMRGMILNHLIHHRGQLSVYLRMLNVALPPIYGPTADEQF